METVSTIGLLKSPSRASFTSTPSSLKAISLWQPWASLIPLGLKHYETRSWKTSYRGKLLICSAAKLTKEQYQQYLKICNEVKLPAWDETNFPRGCAIAICDLVDCIEMTPCFIEQQSKTEILCGDWQPGRYAWKLENIQPIREPFAVKGKQGLFNISQDIFQSQQELTELLGDNQINPSNDEVLGDIENSPSKNISPSNQSPSKLLGDMGIRPELSEVLGDIEVNPSKEALEIDPSNEISPSKMRRHKGEGSGSIHWRNITKNGKDYPQAYYHWKENGQKKTKYIPKKLLLVIQEAEAAKRPVIEILALLGTAASPSKLLGDMGIRPELSEVLGDIEISPSKEALEIDPSNEISPSKMRRHKGEGSGSIHWRNITKNGKDYPQAYYHYEVWEGGDRLIKSSRYIPKRLLTRVQELEQYKAPVREILTLLGINL
ncbi:MAG: ASCH domain-containing protein [Aetokthonos hydrillicola CCALA 1050]|uniref:ASCH domain-containing protein n=1 Tax=Aetokthonos hydrillicola TaxID=1550245 RepID=UPI001ABBC5B3|nr:ASCH domain-containing protein [Aetokthonos hydrillicola CCALA 1050]